MIALTFDDILLVPRYSEMASRSEADIGTQIGPYKFKLPIISSPMDTVTGWKMAATMSVVGGLGIIHRGQSLDDQLNDVVMAFAEAKRLGVENPIFGAAVGAKSSDFSRAVELIKAGVRIICVDVSHGHHANVADLVESLSNYRETLGEPQAFAIIAGNVCTPEGYSFLARAGADAVRVGIGNGSICSTRLNTGFGYPQVSAISEIVETKTRRGYDCQIISDGGCRHPGDIAKALALGSGMVMLGSMLAGTEEAPGELLTSGGATFKVYRGMASVGAQIDWANRVASIEGISSKIPFKGSVTNILIGIRDNLRAAFSYAGARDLKTFWSNAEVAQISSATYRENNTHILEVGVKI